MLKKLALLALAGLMTVGLYACGGEDPETSASSTPPPDSVTESLPEPDDSGSEASSTASEASVDGESQATGNNKDSTLLSGIHTVEIEVENYGTITLDLDADTAPITVTNFIGLVNDGFYDGLTFHRIMDGFMMQGGDPTGTGMGGSDNKITGEFASNGIENDISHVRGAISMARSSENNSASSQFFIVHEDSTFLDGNYAAFGYVTDGIEIVDAVCADAIVQDSNGTVLAEDQPCIVTIRVV